MEGRDNCQYHLDTQGHNTLKRYELYLLQPGFISYLCDCAIRWGVLVGNTFLD